MGAVSLRPLIRVMSQRGHAYSALSSSNVRGTSSPRALIDGCYSLTTNRAFGCRVS
jgi:hypothetical protein